MRDFDKIVDLIIKELLTAQDKNQTEKNIIMRLLKNGYKMEQIDQAFELIIKKINEDEEPGKIVNNYSFKSIRILTETEKYRLTSDANRFLLYHYYNQNITRDELEELLENIEKVDKILDIDNLTDLMQNIIFHKRCQHYQYAGKFIH